MPLLDLKTDLKSIKYGHDRPGGGNSNQPYIKTDINTVDKGINRLRLTNFDDGLIRGGIIGALNASIVDTIRISKFLTDFPKGPLFIVKQVGLQLSNPRLEIPKNRANIIKGGPANALAASTNGLLEPTRIYNLGINTIAQIPVNAFGGHFSRHGILPVQNEASKYEAVVTANNNDVLGSSKFNRLVGLTTKFQLGDRKSNATIDRRIANNINTLFSAITGRPGAFRVNPQDLIIDDYKGGPGSTYGILGRTTINRYSNTEDGYLYSLSLKQSKQFAGQTRNDKGSPTTVLYSSKFLGSSNYASSSLNTNPNNIFNYSSYPTPTTLKDSPATNSDKLASLSHVNNSITNANINLRLGSFYGVSNYSGSSLVSSLFLSTSLPISTSLFIPPVSLTDFDISFQLPSHTRDSDLPIIENKNDLVKNGPSSYPSALNNPFKYSLALPNLVYTGSLTSLTSSYTDIAKINATSSYGNLKIYATITSANQLSQPQQSTLFPFVKSKGILPNSTASISYANGYGEFVAINKYKWNTVTRELRVGSGRQDQINLTPILNNIDRYNGNDTQGTHNIRDLVKFRIQAVNTDGPGAGSLMVFRAYITALTDNVDATWNPVKYAGRGDSFYIYDGFSRKMSVSFKVAALSAQEMKPMYQKLNFLMGNLMPDYGTGNLMRGPLVRMTIGNYIDAQLCKLDSLSITIPNDSPWEIAINDTELILPHIIEVQLSFTPIGSESHGENKISEKLKTTSHIAQNNTGKPDKAGQYIK
jgi:hypothetical protein